MSDSPFERFIKNNPQYQRFEREQVVDFFSWLDDQLHEYVKRLTAEMLFGESAPEQVLMHDLVQLCFVPFMAGLMVTAQEVFGKREAEKVIDDDFVLKTALMVGRVLAQKDFQQKLVFKLKELGLIE